MDMKPSIELYVKITDLTNENRTCPKIVCENFDEAVKLVENSTAETFKLMGYKKPIAELVLIAYLDDLEIVRLTYKYSYRLKKWKRLKVNIRGLRGM